MKKFTLGLLMLLAFSFNALAAEKHETHSGHKDGDKAAPAKHAAHKGHKDGDCKATDKDAKKNCAKDKPETK